MNFDINTFGTELAKQQYVTEDQVATSIFLALKMEKPLLIEGPAGVVKPK